MSTNSSVQHPPESYNVPSESYNRRALPLIIAFVLLVFFLVGFFTIYIFRYMMHLLRSTAWARRRIHLTGGGLNRSGSSPRGLDPVLISSFPTFSYSSVKQLRRRGTALECAVCLAEFSDDDVLRLLRGCYHVFHQDCVDLWLDRHTTCPVCRCELDFLSKSPNFSPPTPNLAECREGSDRDTSKEEDRRHHDGLSVLQRSHSTGHLVVDSDDRFTLRLPEDVLLRRGLRRLDEHSGDLEGGISPATPENPAPSDSSTL